MKTSASTSKRCPSSASAGWTPCLAKKGMPETKTRSRRWKGVGGGEVEVEEEEEKEEEGGEKGGGEGEIDDGERIASMRPLPVCCCCCCCCQDLRIDRTSSRRVTALRIAIRCRRRGRERERERKKETRLRVNVFTRDVRIVKPRPLRFFFSGKKEFVFFVLQIFLNNFHQLLALVVADFHCAPKMSSPSPSSA